MLYKVINDAADKYFNKICTEEFKLTLRQVVYDDCHIFISTIEDRRKLVKEAHSQGFKTIAAFINDIIRVKRMHVNLERIRHGMTPLADRGYENYQNSTLNGTYGYHTRSTPKGVKG